MIVPTIKYSIIKPGNIRYYITSVIYIYTIIGIPLVLGNFTKVIESNIRQENKSDIPDYTPYVETYTDGLLTAGFSLVPVIVPGIIYYSMPLMIDQFNLSNPTVATIFILISLILIITSLLTLYLFPYFSSIQAYRKYDIYEYGDGDFKIFDGFLSILLKGRYNSIVKYFFIISIIISILIQVISYNTYALIVLGPITFLLYINSFAYVIGNLSDSIMHYKEEQGDTNENTEFEWK
jgi:hypothetical protein